MFIILFNVIIFFSFMKNDSIVNSWISLFIGVINLCVN